MSAQKEVLSPHQKTLEQLDAEMKLLRWHKLANESALHAALLRTKRMRNNDQLRASTADANGDGRSHRIRRLVEEERSKPLLMSKDIAKKLREEERHQESLLKEQAERRAKSIRYVIDKVKSREQIQLQRKQCKLFKEQLCADREKGQVEESQAIVPVNSGLEAESQKLNSQLKVISSLEKLIILEERIRRLEENR